MQNDFEFRSGGLVVQYELAKNLNNSMVDVKIISPRNIKNNIYNDFLLTKTLDDVDNTIVVYGETIKGNPLNAKYVIRWILAPIGICSHIDNYKTWDPNDLVYYFNPEDKFIKEPEKVGKEYKLLNIIFINPNAINLNLPTRQGTCYTIRKAHEIHGKPKQPVHPPNSFEITRSHTQEDYVKIFNKYKYFISYDPLTFLSVIAALCGCISIVKKVDGLSKEDWLNMSAYTEYFKESGENTLYGIAYGADDLENAINTLHLVKKQWDDIKNFMINKNIKSFLDDMDNFDTLVNNVQNNFY